MSDTGSTTDNEENIQNSSNSQNGSTTASQTEPAADQDQEPTPGGGSNSSEAGGGGGGGSKTESKAESKADSKVDGQTNSKVDTQPSSKVDAPTGSKVDSKVTSGVKSSSKIQSKADSKVGSKADSKAPSKVESKTASRTESKTSSKMEPMKTGSKVKSSASTHKSPDTSSAAENDADSSTAEVETKTPSQVLDEKIKSSASVKSQQRAARSKSSEGSSAASEHKKQASCEKRILSFENQKHKTSKTRLKVSDASMAKVGFIGSGRMADSITKGLLRQEKVPAKQMYVTSKSGKNLDQFRCQGMTVSTRIYDVFGKFDCDVIFLCVNGYVVRNCFKLGGTRPIPFTTNYIPCRKKQIYILSLIGGISLADVKVTLLNPETPNKYNLEIHRCMLNTSVAYGLGLGALDVEIDSKKCGAVVRDLLQAIARIEYFDADLMDAACCVGGNGLAYVYYFMSALADGGFKMGLSKNTAIKLAAKSLQSAALVLLESNKSPSELRDSCTSPGNAIIYGITILERQDCAAGIQTAVESSYRRIRELVDVDPATSSGTTSCSNPNNPNPTKA